jgi:2'-5' RNA ligase
MARLFFALWPPARARAGLERLAAGVALVSGGKAVEAAKIHLTLAFLGEVDEARAAAAGEVAATLRARPFVLRLDRVGSFRRSRVAWAGASELPVELLALQSALDRGLRGNGFELEERPFRPHITLARKTRERVPQASIETIDYACDALALVASDLGRGEYRTLESWPLGPDERG